MTHITTVFDSVALGQLIRTERKRQQLTQKQLAGVAVRFPREQESGKGNCRTVSPRSYASDFDGSLC
ncbi:hypothetical protein APZ00_20140 [Pannonibacter phragmitetus]|uniref:Uncharacterized protein n=1 Tax=Pannonibacter phragmitetus TaxID=121719 RepID=A0A0U3QCN7_9HYPH|nr:hypothetical protein APZ00_20140 [Pannonibacter phragmitetus]